MIELANLHGSICCCSRVPQETEQQKADHLPTFAPAKISFWTGGENPGGSSPRRGGDGYASEVGRIAACCSEKWDCSFPIMRAVRAIERSQKILCSHQMPAAVGHNMTYDNIVLVSSLSSGTMFKFHYILQAGGKCSQTLRRPDSELAKSVSGQLDKVLLSHDRGILSAQ